ncbi:hypothetical protein BT96DRAFT_1000434 [Gymnopus androsaceus JB14]|uniref:Uncharacterized protein n=1 Tax=Gymnopus androsaceus JB14 TaxID=1447944 RepID=A0A6A4H274_9AGAR|nr:hypothetical protein BT96DRAFT_1000434 [Gymnopus androsaceus JB14]
MSRIKTQSLPSATASLMPRTNLAFLNVTVSKELRPAFSAVPSSVSSAATTASSALASYAAQATADFPRPLSVIYLAYMGRDEASQVSRPGGLTLLRARNLTSCSIEGDYLGAPYMTLPCRDGESPTSDSGWQYIAVERGLSATWRESISRISFWTGLILVERRADVSDFMHQFATSRLWHFVATQTVVETPFTDAFTNRSSFESQTT